MRDKDNPREGESPSEIDLARLAAFLDGEGCIDIRKYTNRGTNSPAHQGRVTVGNTDRKLPEYFDRFFPAPIYIRRWVGKRGEGIWKVAYVYTAQGKTAYDLVRAARPYLLMKNAQADAVLELADKFKSFKNAPGHQRVSTEELDRREALYVLVKSLNRKGPPPATTEREDARDGEPTV